MPNFFERASAGITSLINDAAIRARAAKSTTSALTRVGGEFGERLSRALERAAALRRSKDVETDDLCDLQVGQNCYEDSPGFMRTQLWESLLDRSGESMMVGKASHASKEAADGGLSDGEDILDDMCAVLAADGYYETLQDAFGTTERTNAGKDVGSSSDAWNENIGASIERDLARTFPNHEHFLAATEKGANGRKALARILKAYAVHDPKVGYCQGMAFVAGLLLIYLPENRAFAAFVTLMENGDFRGMYGHGMEGLKSRLRQLSVVLRAKNPTLAAHLEKNDVAPVLYASGWFMSAFASDFSVRFSGRVMDCLLAQRTSSFIMRVCVALVNEASADLLKINDFEALVVYLKSEPRVWPRERLNSVMEQALAMSDLTDEEIARLDAEASTDEALPRVMSPIPRATRKSNSSTTPNEETADPSSVNDEVAESEKILDVLAMLDLEDWTSLDYGEHGASDDNAQTSSST